MSDAVEPLILDLLEWVAATDRSYAETMDAWRTSCPRLPVWEDANERGFISREVVKGRAVVRVTPSGVAFLARERPARLAAPSASSVPGIHNSLF